jgi:N-methylhydantoinase A
LTIEFVRTVLSPLDSDGLAELQRTKSALDNAVGQWFDSEAVAPAERETQYSAGLRYFGQNYELSLPLPSADVDATVIVRMSEDFHRAHEISYGFASSTEKIQLVNLKVKAIGKLTTPALPDLATRVDAEPVAHRNVLFNAGERHATPIYQRTNLAAGQTIAGPAVIEQMDATMLVFPGDHCTVDQWGNLIISLQE